MKLDRLLGILTILLQNDRVTAPFLAEKFEVSRRTIGRDIDALCLAGIPVVTYQGGRGGISIAEGYKLDKTVLTTDELSDLIAALKGLGSVSKQSQVERTLDKLSAGKDSVVALGDSIIIDLGSYHKISLTEKIDTIKQAIRERRLVSFDYYYEKGKMRRKIEPYFITFHWTAWYVFGYCPQRGDFRMFKLARLWELHLCQEAYLPRDIPPERTDFEAGFTDENTLVALFDPSVKHQLIETYGLDCYTETEDGKLRFEFRYTNQAFILGWLLSFGDKAKVLEPVSLAQEMRENAQKMLKHYSGLK